MLPLAVAGLLVSGYLTYTSWAGVGPPGCGGGSGCDAVLASKWSRFLGLPVSGFATLAYVAVIGTTLATGAGAAGVRRAAWALLVALATLIACAAIWFIYLQVAVLGEICPYCMAGHAIGLLLATAVLPAAPRRSAAAIVAGLVAAGVMIGVQSASRETVHRATTVSVAADRDTRAEGSRRVELLGGALSLDVSAEPHLGSPDAAEVLVLMFDYACPHCRQTHGVLRDYVAAGAGRSIVVVAAPTPVHRGCNPFALEEMPARFEESCELARIALAVHAADPAAFETFDAWMFEPRTPRSARDARAKAVELVGGEAFDAAYGDPAVAAAIERNVAAYGELGESRRVPAVLLPGREPVIGAVEDVAAVAELLSQPRVVP